MSSDSTRSAPHTVTMGNNATYVQGHQKNYNYDTRALAPHTPGDSDDDDTESESGPGPSERRRTSHTARRTGAGRRHPAGTTPAHAGRTNNTAASYPTTYQTRNPVAIPGQQQFEAPRHFECASFKEYQVTPAEAPNPAWHPDINAASTLAPLASGPVSHQHPFNRQNGWGTPVFAASAQLGPQESYGISNSHGYGSSHPGYWPPENLAMQPPGTQAYQAPSYGQRFDHAMYQSSEPQSNSYAQMQQSSVPMQGCQPPNPHFDHGIMNKPPVHLTP